MRAIANGGTTRSSRSCRESTSWTRRASRSPLRNDRQAERREPLEPLVDAHPQIGQHAERGVVTDQPLAVAAAGRGTARRTARPTIAIAIADSCGRCEEREISHAEVAIRPIAAPSAPGAEQRRERQPPGGGTGDRERPRQRGLVGAEAVGRGHAATSTGASDEHPIGQRQQRGAVRDQHDRAPARRGARTASSTSASVWPSRLAVGSSSSSSGASRRNARASATRWRSPAESPAPRSPSTVSRPARQAGHHVVEPGRGDRRADLLVRRVAAAEAHVLGDRGGEQMRSLGHPREPRAPGVGVELGEVDAPDADRSALGGDEARAGRPAASTCRTRWGRRARAPLPAPRSARRRRARARSRPG